MVVACGKYEDRHFEKNTYRGGKVFCLFWPFIQVKSPNEKGTAGVESLCENVSSEKRRLNNEIKSNVMSFIRYLILLFKNISETINRK